MNDKMFLLLKCLAFIVAAVYAWDLMAAWGWPLWLAIPGEGMVAGLFFSPDFRAACAEGVGDGLVKSRDPSRSRGGWSEVAKHVPSIWG